MFLIKFYYLLTQTYFEFSEFNGGVRIPLKFEYHVVNSILNFENFTDLPKF